MVKMQDWNEQIFRVIERSRTRSKATAVITPCQMIVANNPNRIKSKAASVNGINTAKVISEFLRSNGKKL